METPDFSSFLRFAALAARPEADVDLAEGALLIADIAYPALNHRRYLRHLDALAATVRAELGTELGKDARELLRADRVERRDIAERVLGALRGGLVEREGFHGNVEDYYDPENSFLNTVLERRTGLPILLSIVYIEVARRLGAPLQGVGLPAHFLAKWPLPPEQGGDLFIDAFHGGRVLDLAGCRRLIARLAGESATHLLADSHWTEPAGKRAVLTRLLHNLKVVYLQRGETALALEVVERLVLLRPDLAEELRDRGLLRLAMGEPLLAAVDIATYAERTPDAPDVQRLRRRLARAAEIRAKLN